MLLYLGDHRDTSLGDEEWIHREIVDFVADASSLFCFASTGISNHLV